MALFGKKNANYISAKETKRISKENRKITNEIEKKRNRKNIPESEYITTMKNPENVVEFDNVHTYFFTDIGTVKAVWLSMEESFHMTSRTRLFSTLALSFVRSREQRMTTKWFPLDR